MTDTNILPSAKPEPLFSLDLGANGGIFAPTSLEDLNSWIALELNFWNWAQQRSFGGHDGPLRDAIQYIQRVLSAVQQAQHHRSTGSDQYHQQIEACRSYVHEAFATRRLPHSSTPLARRVEALRAEVSDRAASYFVATQINPLSHPGSYQAQDLDSWRGMVEGVLERFQIASVVPSGRSRAADESFELLRTKAEHIVGEKNKALEALHRDYLVLAEAVRQTADEQTRGFDSAQTERRGVFEAREEAHQQAMEDLRKTFREELALRAPADYWDKKRSGHRLWASVTGALSFLGIGSAAGGLGWQIHEVLVNTPRGATPEPWRLAVLALIGVFSVWALRLLVRMFLSHLHLLADAGERVVMVRTYLSLLEGDRLASKDDRQLILQALFRPASDGLVKDEGVPFSLAEMLTRTGRP